MILLFSAEAVAKAAASASVRVEALTRCEPATGGLLQCLSDLWIYDRWRGKLGTSRVRLELTGAQHVRWSEVPDLNLAAETVTRSVRYLLPAGAEAVVAQIDHSEIWSLWRPNLPVTVCTSATNTDEAILAQPLATQVRAPGWRLGARSATGRPGVDFAAASTSSRTLRTVLMDANRATACTSTGSLHIPPQPTDPYVWVMTPGTQLLLTLPLAVIP